MLGSSLMCFSINLQCCAYLYNLPRLQFFFPTLKIIPEDNHSIPIIGQMRMIIDTKFNFNFKQKELYSIP